VSWSKISIEEEERTMPVNPPIVNKKINPKIHKRGVLIFNLVPKIVLNHEKILTPVGTAMTIVAAVKYARVSTSIPTVNI
jgi:hypothetical protein